MMRRRAADAVCLALLAWAGYAIGTRMIADAARSGHHPFFYQSYFAPAIMSACGHGYRNASAAHNATLAAFLEEQRDALSCSDMPVAAPEPPLDAFQGISRYFELAVALVWRIRGISWSVLAPVFGIAVACTAAATFGLFRVFAGPAVAMVATALTAFSPLALANLPNLRDYAKAPFLVALLAVIAAILRAPRRRDSLVAFGIAAGVLEGIGIGFRTDLWLFVPLMVALFFAARVSDVAEWRARAIAAACFLVLSASIAWPVLRAYRQGSNSPHVVLLGFASQFTSELGISRTDYDAGGLYNDEYLYARVRAFADTQGRQGLIPIGSHQYDQTSGQYLGLLIRLIPGDLVTRATGAVFGVFRVAFQPHGQDLPYVSEPLQSLFVWHDRVVTTLRWLVLPVSAAVVAYGLTVEAAATASGLVVFLFLTSAAVLQFHPRHFFYLETLCWLPAVIAVALVRNVAHLRRPGKRGIAIVTAGAGAIVLLTAVVIVVARHTQERRLAEVVTSLRSAPRRGVPLVPQRVSAESVLLSVPDGRDERLPPAQAMIHPVTARRLAIVVGGVACDRLALPVVYRYRSTSAFEDFSEAETMALPLDGSAVTAYRSVFDVDGPSGTIDVDEATPALSKARFAGIEIPQGAAGCISQVSTVPESAWPQPLTALDDAPPGRWTERFSWERSPSSTVVPIPASLSRRAVIAALGHPLVRDHAFMAHGVRRQNDGFRIAGRMDNPFSYLIGFRERPAAPGDLAIVSGDVHDGGVTVGLTRDGSWAVSINVTDHGPFTIALAPPSPGTYELVVANCLFAGATHNDVNIDRAGWTDR